MQPKSQCAVLKNRYFRPCAPLSVTVDQVERVSGGGSVTISISWLQPQNFDLFDIDHYIINVTSTSGVQVIACRCTSTVMIMGENINNVQMITNITTTVAAVNLCGETGPGATVTTSYALSKMSLLHHNQLFCITCC